MHPTFVRALYRDVASLSVWVKSLHTFFLLDRLWTATLDYNRKWYLTTGYCIGLVVSVNVLLFIHILACRFLPHSLRCFFVIALLLAGLLLVLILPSSREQLTQVNRCTGLCNAGT